MLQLMPSDAGTEAPPPPPLTFLITSRAMRWRNTSTRLMVHSLTQPLKHSCGHTHLNSTGFRFINSDFFFNCTLLSHFVCTVLIILYVPSVHSTRKEHCLNGPCLPMQMNREQNTISCNLSPSCCEEMSCTVATFRTITSCFDLLSDHSCTVIM